MRQADSKTDKKELVAKWQLVDGTLEMKWVDLSDSSSEKNNETGKVIPLSSSETSDNSFEHSKVEKYG